MDQLCSCPHARTGRHSVPLVNIHEIMKQRASGGFRVEATTHSEIPNSPKRRVEIKRRLTFLDRYAGPPPSLNVQKVMCQAPRAKNSPNEKLNGFIWVWRNFVLFFQSLVRGVKLSQCSSNLGLIWNIFPQQDFKFCWNTSAVYASLHPFGFLCDAYIHKKRGEELVICNKRQIVSQRGSCSYPCQPHGVSVSSLSGRSPEEARLIGKFPGGWIWKSQSIICSLSTRVSAFVCLFVVCLLKRRVGVVKAGLWAVGEAARLRELPALLWPLEKNIKTERLLVIII